MSEKALTEMVKMYDELKIENLQLKEEIERLKRQVENLSKKRVKLIDIGELPIPPLDFD